MMLKKISLFTLLFSFGCVMQAMEKKLIITSSVEEWLNIRNLILELDKPQVQLAYSHEDDPDRIDAERRVLEHLEREQRDEQHVLKKRQETLSEFIAKYDAPDVLNAIQNRELGTSKAKYKKSSHLQKK